jgi:SAM-dependent MidA family methyltransferase
VSQRERILTLITAEGPITVERYMELCLAHYYAGRDPLGAAGDFTTAPEISQMFGELIGLWGAALWQAMGSPTPFRLIELGPGRGTLMADALRATARVPGLREAVQVHLVETSPALRERQRGALAPSGVAVHWHETVEEVPTGPAIAIANEFFDALPIQQYEATERGWCERRVALDGEGLRFVVQADPDPTVDAPLRPGAVVERNRATAGIVRTLAARFVGQGGALLAIDYGYWGPAFGDTLQALRAHAFTDPLEEPGEADLTAHVDFREIARAAAEMGAAVHGPVSQGDFLRALGIELRASALKARATPVQAEAVETALLRLTDSAGMGELFKVLAIADHSLQTLPGLRPNPLEDEP